MGWAQRTLAKKLGYGVNKAFVKIKQTSDTLALEHWAPKGNYSYTLLLDGSEQEIMHPEGKLLVAPSWEDGKVSFIVRQIAESSASLSTRRYLNDSEMVEEQVSKQGLTIKRYFQRQDTNFHQSA